MVSSLQVLDARNYFWGGSEGFSFGTFLGVGSPGPSFPTSRSTKKMHSTGRLKNDITGVRLLRHVPQDYFKATKAVYKAQSQGTNHEIERGEDARVYGRVEWRTMGGS